MASRASPSVSPLMAYFAEMREYFMHGIKGFFYAERIAASALKAGDNVKDSVPNDEFSRGE